MPPDRNTIEKRMTFTRQETLACLIIDDPLLTPNYGCLNYEALLAEMKEHRFFTEIAYIPMNWKRSNPHTVRLIADNPEYFALCVHGCNHSGAEFCSGSLEDLRALATTALWRMDRHRELTGLAFDPVMVFPRGQFSKEALRALADSGYEAAFNSNLGTVSGEQPPPEDFKRPATTAYHDFPLFLRRDPDEFEALSQDIEAGRPALLVAHHTDFAEGYETITNTVDWINRHDNVRWTSLSNIARHYCGESNRSATREAVSAMAVPPCPDVPLGMAARRTLSEIRDNYVETNPVLRRLYTNLHRTLKRHLRSRLRRARKPVAGVNAASATIPATNDSGLTDNDPNRSLST